MVLGVPVFKHFWVEYIFSKLFVGCFMLSLCRCYGLVHDQTYSAVNLFF